MNPEEFSSTRRAILESIRRFPNCTIANCECDSRHGEWKDKCNCMCHFRQMDEVFGKGQWALKDFNKKSWEKMKK